MGMKFQINNNITLNRSISNLNYCNKALSLKISKSKNLNIFSKTNKIKCRSSNVGLNNSINLTKRPNSKIQYYTPILKVLFYNYILNEMHITPFIYYFSILSLIYKNNESFLDSMNNSI